MHDSLDKPRRASTEVRTPPIAGGVDSAHYLRQASITLRRHSSWLNQACCKYRQSLPDATPWKH